MKRRSSSGDAVSPAVGVGINQFWTSDDKEGVFLEVGSVLACDDTGSHPGLGAGVNASLGRCHVCTSADWSGTLAVVSMSMENDGRIVPRRRAAASFSSRFTAAALSFCADPLSIHTGFSRPKWQVICKFEHVAHIGLLSSHLFFRSRHVQQPSWLFIDSQGWC